MIWIPAFAGMTSLPACRAENSPSTDSAVHASTGSPTTPLLRLVPLERWPAFNDDFTKASLLRAAQKSLEYVRSKAADQPIYHTVDRDLATKDLIASLETFIRIAQESKDHEEFNKRLRGSFDLYQSVGSDGVGKVVFSDYYVPVYPAGLKPTAKYKYPLYSWPPDLIVADLGIFDLKLKGQTVIGRMTAEKTLVPYHTRHEIDSEKVLAGKGLEVAWMADQFERLDIHIQGSGILQLEDGRRLLARHTITSGLKYESVGLALINAGLMTKAEMSHERLHQYLKEHPDKESWAIELNPRYVFFEVVALPSDGETFGRIQNSWTTSLTTGRSIAIDPNIFPLGSIAYFEGTTPKLDPQGKFAGTSATSRFAFPQDTGGAILGPGRVDLYVGAGEQAKAIATHQWSNGKLYILFKKSSKS